MAPSRNKNYYRTYWKDRRQELADLSLQHSNAICSRIIHSQAFKNAPRVGLFSARPWEIDLKKIWETAPKKCFFPVTNSQDKSMEFYSIDTWKDLEPAAFDILEPKKIRTRQLPGWTSKDLILVPGVVFDKQGGRVGSGAGYYDRYLQDKTATFWGVCLQAQVEQSPLDQEPTDVRMRALCTELTIHVVG